MQKNLWFRLLIPLLLTAMACNLPPSPDVTQTPTPTGSEPTEEAAAEAPPIEGMSATEEEEDEDEEAAQAPSPTDTSKPPAATPPSAAPSETLPTDTPAAEHIQSFTISPELIDPGESVLLAWETTGDSANLCELWSTGQLGDCWEVPTTGSEVVTVDGSKRNTASYHLYVTVGEETEQAWVTVAITCPDTWFFDNGPTSCPYAAETSYGVYEHFEHGLMIWVQSRGTIYIFYSDNQRPFYELQPDPWELGKPESDPTIEPPDEFYQPVRGFGLLWRNDEDLISNNVRERLGWATEPEQGFDTTIQCDSAPKYSTCYLSGPDGVIELLPEKSGWSIWTGPTATP